jgi:hypothetical protein
VISNPSSSEKLSREPNHGEEEAIMPSKLFVHAEPENHFVGVTEFVELCRLPLEGGRPYFVQARGMVGLEAGVIMLLRLNVCGFFGEVVSSRQSSYINDNQQFVLTAAATLPSEGGGSGPGVPPPPGASANLLVKTIWPSHQPGHSVSIVDILLTALQVDEIVVA